MDIANDRPRRGERSLTHQLKAKSRGRREGLERLRSASPARAPRNDPLPDLDLAYISLEDLRMPSREIRKLDPAHVREVANAIITLGFCAPVLVGRDNAVIDGVVRVEAARQLGLGRAPCVRIEHLNDTEQRVLRLAVNRLRGGRREDCGAGGPVSRRAHEVVRPLARLLQPELTNVFGEAGADLDAANARRCECKPASLGTAPSRSRPSAW